MLELLKHPYPYVRYWAVRLVGDEKTASDSIFNSLVALASSDESLVVRSQLAASAKRLPASQALPIVEALLTHHPNESDARIPWLIWWAIESKTTSDIDRVVEMFSKESMWANPAARENNLRLIRRFAAEGTLDSYNACFRLLQTAPAAFVAEAHGQLRLGLAERAAGLQDIGQGDLFGGQAAIGDGESTTKARRYEPVAGPLLTYIGELWRQRSAR